MAVDGIESREFLRASSIKEAATILAERDAVLISGGQSLMPLLRQGMVESKIIVDISNIDNHNEVHIDEDGLHVGGLVTHRSLIQSGLTEKPWRALAETAKTIGDRQVRNWGTVGGAIAHADPSLDYPPTMAALDGRVTVTDGESVEELPVLDLYVGPYVTALDPEQIVIEVAFPRPPTRTGVQFEKFSWRKGDMAMVNAAARISVDEDGIVTEARICVGSIVPRPTRLSDLEANLVGTDADDREHQAEVAAAVPEYTDPIHEEHASVEYKNRIGTNLVREALHGASARALGEN